MEYKEGDSITLNSGEVVTFLQEYGDYRAFDFVAMLSDGTLRNFKWNDINITKES